MDSSTSNTRRWSLDSGRWVTNEPMQSGLNKAERSSQRLRPFVAWKRLVDGAFATMISPVTQTIEERRSTAQAKADEELVWRRRWYGHDNVSKPPNVDAFLAKLIATMLLDGAEAETANLSPYRIRALLADDRGDMKKIEQDAQANAMLAFGGASYFSPDVGDRLPSAQVLCRRAQSQTQPRWLSMVWFKRSPYSPVQLEAVTTVDHIKWRAAFEDLLHTSLGRQVPRLLPLEAELVSKSSALSGLSWTLALLLSGALPSIPPSDTRRNGPFATTPMMSGRRNECGMHEIASEIQALGDIPIIRGPRAPAVFLPWDDRTIESRSR